MSSLGYIGVGKSHHVFDTAHMTKMKKAFGDDLPLWTAMQDFKIYADQWNENRARKRRCFDFYFLRKDGCRYVGFYCEFFTTHTHLRTYQLEPEFKILDPPPFSVYAEREKLRAEKQCRPTANSS